MAENIVYTYHLLSTFDHIKELMTDVIDEEKLMKIGLIRII